MAAIAVRDRMDQTKIDVPPGLANVVVAETELGDVRGIEGFYHYRDHSATTLARTRSVEDVWRLMIDGRLPEDAERAAFAAEVRASRALPAALEPLLEPISRSTRTADALAGLRAVIPVLAGVRGFRPLYDEDEPGRRSDALSLGAAVPSVLAALHRVGTGRRPVAPRADLDHAANYLWMLSGREPDDRVRAAIEAYLVSTIDHGFNASTFTARVVASTGGDLGAVVTAALGSLSGPLHGGAPSRALQLLDLGSAAAASAYVRQQVAIGGRVMGFGHAVYRTEDPRSALMKEVALGFGGPRVDLAIEIEAAVLRTLEEVKPGRALRTNVEFYAALVMEACGIPPEMFTATFAVARVLGWTAHALEQARTGKIIRPASRYVGPEPTV
ncbi:MAG TPA: citrate/2-methylcitrate synthase [Microlunatus sp.]|nr:citrate/2-methylcitrate synthase [Microlunatus sp.]